MRTPSVSLFVLVVFVLGTLADRSSAIQGSGTQNVDVRATVQRSSVTGIYKYVYTVRNATSNAGSIATIELDIAEPPGGAALSDLGLTNGERFLGDIAQAIRQDPKRVATVPVGLQSPLDWSVVVSLLGNVGWIGEGSSAFLRPGGVLSGFEVNSRGLPAVRIMVCAPHVNIDDVAIEPPGSNADLARYDAELASFRKSLSARVITIGPSAPPADFRPETFVAAIVDYRRQATDYGWISDRGVGNSLDAKFSAARAAIERGNARAATNILNAALHEIDAQADKQLSSEAVALLRYNTEYLIGRLR